MHKLVLSFLFMITSFTLFSQVQFHENCGHNLLVQGLENQFPGYKNLLDYTFKKAKLDAQDTRMVYTIKTVVHVVWKEGDENIDDQDIYDQIAVLNEDFRLMNADVSNLRMEFDSVSADPMIEFELVAIERVETTETFGVDLLTGFEDSKLKVTANGGSSPWDVNEHLNIWVCNIQPLSFAGQVAGQILGYAYPPINIADYPDINNWPTDQLAVFQEAQYDGVVMHYKTFGGRDRMDTFEVFGEIELEGRTVVHEVGHYLGLRHVWGDAIILLGEDGCAVDDGIEDTPNTANNSQALGCLDTNNTCTDNSNDLPDMWENYMDYSSESCQVTFTKGQVDIMRAVLEGPRFSLIDNVVAVENMLTLDDVARIYPNPSTGVFQLTMKDQNENYFVEVTDLMGNRMASFQSTSNTTINMMDKANGVYFVKIKQGELFATKRIVVSK